MQGLSATQLSDPQEIVNAFKQAEQAELVGVREVRGEIFLFYTNKREVREKKYFYSMPTVAAPY